jgi:hypothetical protein
MRQGTQVLKVSFLSALALAVLFGLFWPASVGAVLYVHANPIALQWQAATGAVDHYNVYLSVNQQPFVLHNQVASGSCSISALDGSRYVVQVEAEDPYGTAGPMSDPSEEIIVYLNGSAADTDGDGMSNVWEVSYGLNPYNPADGSGDPDSDGLTNSAECLAGTVPTDADSDNDGILDGAEVLHGQNPLNPGDNVPVANGGPDRQLDPTVVTLDGSASSDPNGDPLAYSWTQVRGDAVQLSGPTSVRPSFIGRKWGEYSFRLVVSDGRVNSAPDEVSITMRNVQPTADAGADQVVDAGAQIVLDAAGSQDPNGDALTFNWSQVEGPPVALSGATSQRASFVPSAAGVCGFQLVASDGVNASSPDQVQVTVNALNQVPTAQAGADQTVRVNDQVTLDGSASTDPDADALQYSWTQVGGPETVLLESASTAQPWFVPGLAGAYRFQLVVNDGKVASAADEVTVTAQAENHPPVAVILGVAPVDVGDRVVLNGEGSYDPDGDPLTFEWTQTEGALAALEDADAQSAAFYAISEGVLKFQLVVRDGELESQPVQVGVTVNGLNQVPVANAGADLQGVLKRLACLDGSASYDPDGEDVLGYSWSQIAGPRVTLRNANTAKPCFTPRNIGDYQFQLVVTDGKVESAPDTVTVVVQRNGNHHRPVAKVDPYYFVVPGSEVELDGGLSYDFDRDQLKYFWSQKAGQSVRLAVQAKPTIKFVAPEEGYYTFGLRVSDGKLWSEEQITEVWASANLPPGCSISPARMSGSGGNSRDLLFVPTIFLPAICIVLYQKRKARRNNTKISSPLC